MNNVLVIDDNADIRENIAEILELAGYKTTTAANGKQGVEIAQKELPDVIVCDIMMPELDGYGVLHLLKKNPKTVHIPFVFLTAKTERSDLRKGMEMGADDYITKPFEDIELLNAIEIRLKKATVLKAAYMPTQEDVGRFLKDVKQHGLISQLEERYEVATFSKKQLLYQEGKKPRFLYYILSGKVKIAKQNGEGKEYVTDLCVGGDFIGYSALMEDEAYAESAEVLEETEVLLIPKNDFNNMLYGNIDVAIKFIQILAKNVKDKEERMLSLAYSSLRKRVAKALVDIQDKFYSQHGDVPLEISREDFARYIGTATESLIRTLSDFKSEGLITVKTGKVIISDYDKLKNLQY